MKVYLINVMEVGEIMDLEEKIIAKIEKSGFSKYIDEFEIIDTNVSLWNDYDEPIEFTFWGVPKFKQGVVIPESEKFDDYDVARISGSRSINGAVSLSLMFAEGQVEISVTKDGLKKFEKLLSL